MANSVLISVRGTSADSERMFPGQSNILKVVKDYNGNALDVDEMTFFQKLKYRNSDVYAVLTGTQRLVFRQSLRVNGWQVQAKLTMLVAPDRSLETFLKTFYHDQINHVTTGLLVSALEPSVRAAIAENLSFVNVGRVPKGAVIRNAARHTKLGDVCRNKGLHLFTDELVLESIC